MHRTDLTTRTGTARGDRERREAKKERKEEGREGKGGRRKEGRRGGASARQLSQRLYPHRLDQHLHRNKPGKLPPPSAMLELIAGTTYAQQILPRHQIRPSPRHRPPRICMIGFS